MMHLNSKLSVEMIVWGREGISDKGKMSCVQDRLISNQTQIMQIG